MSPWISTVVGVPGIKMSAKDIKNSLIVINSVALGYANTTANRFTGETFTYTVNLKNAYNVSSVGLSVTFTGDPAVLSFPQEYVGMGTIVSLASTSGSSTNTISLGSSVDMNRLAIGDEVIQNDSKHYHETDYLNWDRVEFVSNINIFPLKDDPIKTAGAYGVSGGGWLSGSSAFYTEDFINYTLFSVNDSSNYFVAYRSDGRTIVYGTSNLYYSDDPYGPGMRWTSQSHGFPGTNPYIYGYSGTYIYLSTEVSGERRTYRSDTTLMGGYTALATIVAGRTDMYPSQISGFGCESEFVSSYYSGSPQTQYLYYSSDWGASWSLKYTGSAGYSLESITKLSTTYYGVYYAIAGTNKPFTIYSSSNLASWSSTGTSITAYQSAALMLGSSSGHCFLTSYGFGGGVSEMGKLTQNSGSTWSNWPSTAATGLPSGEKYRKGGSKNLGITMVGSSGNGAESGGWISGRAQPRGFVTSIDTVNKTVGIETAVANQKAWVANANKTLRTHDKKNVGVLTGKHATLNPTGVVSTSGIGLGTFFNITSGNYTLSGNTLTGNITFPSTLYRYDNATPDTEFPYYSQMQVRVQLTNKGGTVVGTSDTSMPIN